MSVIRRPPIDDIVPRPEPPPPKRRVTKHVDTLLLRPEEKEELRVRTLATLKLNGYNVAYTARQLNLRKQTIRDWLKRDEEAQRRYLENKERTEREDHQRACHEAKERQLEQKGRQDDQRNETTRTVVTLSLEKMAQLANEIVESLRGDLTPDSKPLKFYDRAWAFGVVFDKLQVAQGNPTQIHGRTQLGMSRHQRLEQLLETAEERRRKLKVLVSEEEESVKAG